MLLRDSGTDQLVCPAVVLGASTLKQGRAVAAGPTPNGRPTATRCAGISLRGNDPCHTDIVRESTRSLDSGRLEVHSHGTWCGGRRCCPDAFGRTRPHTGMPVSYTHL